MRTYSTRPYFLGMKHKRLYVAIVLAILGIAVIGVSMTMIHGQTKAIPGVVLGGALIQAGIAVFAFDWSKVRRTARRRSRP
jgi:VIT1/CCC1 family predicted Fe2+/Mn2+ transporter